jgi:FtsH-binding integral membrane protein
LISRASAREIFFSGIESFAFFLILRVVSCFFQKKAQHNKGGEIMKEYQAGFNDGTWAVDPKAKPEVQARTKKQAQMLSMGKIYLWTALGLLITGLIAFLTPDVLMASGNTETTANVYVGILIASLAVILPITIVMMILPFRTKPESKGVATIVFYLLYTIAMGFLLSAIFMVLFAAEGEEFGKVIGIAFLMTAGCFGLMGLIGTFVKKLNAIIPVVLTLAIGVLTLSLVNFFFYNEMIYWITDFVCFALILLCTALDIHNIKKIVQHTDFGNATALSVYLAFNLYIDFIRIFLYVLYYVAIIFGKNKN